MKKKKDKDDFIRKHEYPGGKKAFLKYIAENLIYPKEAMENKIEGTILIEFEVGFEGQVSKAKVVHGIGYGCDEEALRLIRSLKYAPQNNHGVRMLSSHKSSIRFKLPAKPASTVIKYDISPSGEEKEKNKKSGYSYTIKL